MLKKVSRSPLKSMETARHSLSPLVVFGIGVILAPFLTRKHGWQLPPMGGMIGNDIEIAPKAAHDHVLAQSWSPEHVVKSLRENDVCVSF